RRTDAARRRGTRSSRDESGTASPRQIRGHGGVLELSAQPFHPPADRSAIGPTEGGRSTHPPVCEELVTPGVVAFNSSQRAPIRPACLRGVLGPCSPEWRKLRSIGRSTIRRSDRSHLRRPVGPRTI